MPHRPQSAEPSGVPQGSGEPPEAAPAKSGGIERRRHPRIRLDADGPDAIASGFREVERRQGERRQQGNLRDNVGWTVANDRGNRAGGRLKFRFKKSRIFVLGIAAIAGGIAAYLSSQIGYTEVPPAPAALSATDTRVLVAGQHISAGQRLSASSLAWQAWPQQALQPDYITSGAAPAAMTDMSGFMARSDFLPGDPIRRQKLTQGAGGFLSAALDKGMRGVSVVVTAESASGGFISPDDRVDVVLTRSSTGGIGGGSPRSETILHNVRVLAINSKTVEPGSLGASADQPRSNTFSGQAIATLALDPSDADLAVSASSIGKLSLLLRSAADAAVSDGKAKAPDSTNQAIRMSSPFWMQ